MTDSGAADTAGPTTGSTASLRGLPFVKMTGSGNDFVFFDGRSVPIELVTQPEAIKSICNRYNGIGADGIVVLEPLSGDADVHIHYYNSDGTAADLCGNATLCSTALSVELGLAQASGMRLSTGAGLINSRLEHLPAIALQPVTDIRPDMPIDLAAVGDAATGSRAGSRIGFAVAGIPHLVILCEDADAIDVAGLGPALRRHPASGPAGANVNWVSARPDGSWRYRTFERGVEGETLACGTGAVATAVLLATWGLADRTVVIRTSSGRDVEVLLAPLPGDSEGARSGFAPTLRGEGRIVFRGKIADI
ncbi:diaminopimelate epimerase [Gemmatimonas aurantiaca]|uniref:diaminopimelate epimerase n=1 Tax=Gemmatimonas aurantiaca TaxID=173480 RepID=UPI00301D71C9